MLQLSPSTTYTLQLTLTGTDDNQQTQYLEITDTTTITDVINFYMTCIGILTSITLVNGNSQIVLTDADEAVLGLLPLRALQGCFTFGRQSGFFGDPDCATTFNLWKNTSYTTDTNGLVDLCDYVGIDGNVTLTSNLSDFKSYLNGLLGTALMKRVYLQTNL
jgi:hypothetical protein